MTNKFKSVLVISVCLTFVLTINSCKKDEETKGIDKELYEMAKNADGVTWFKNSSALLNKSAGSGHPQPLLRTRYNSEAASVLDANGLILSNATFPEGSLVVKELFESANSLARYAILYKKSGSADADANGWIWGYINSDGSVAESATKKGSACISCHSQADNIDYMLMNKYFP